MTVLFRGSKLCRKRTKIPSFREFLGYVILVRMTTCFGTLVLSWQQLSFARREAVGFFKVVRCHKIVVSCESFSGPSMQSTSVDWGRGGEGGGGILPVRHVS